MNPGELRHRIALQSQSGGQDSFGELIDEGWTDYTTVWASINPLVGKEIFAVETINNELTHKIRIRYKAGITPDMRIKFGTRYFRIISVINYQERNVELQLMCRELL